MAKFRKKSVMVEAWQWLGRNYRDYSEFYEKNELPAWSFGSRGGKSGIIVTLTTPGSAQVAQTGDWIIRNSRGEFSVCKSDAFKEIYELMED